MEEIFDSSEAAGKVNFLIFDATNPVQPSLREMADFACGFGSSVEEERILDVMLESSAMRRKVIELQTCVQTFSNIALEKISPVTPEEVAVADTLRERAAAIVGFCVEPTANATPNRWEIACRAFLEATKSLFSIPRFASTRSAGEEALIGVAPGLTATTSFIKDDEQVKAKVVFTGDFGAALGQIVVLNLVDPIAGALPLASTELTSHEWIVPLDGFPAESNLKLDVTLNNTRPPIDRHTSVATISDSSRVVPIEVIGTPTVKAGELRVEIQLAAPVRASFSESDFCLMLQLGGVSQQLGAWPIKEWGTEPRLIAAQVPSRVEGDFQCMSLIRAHIR